MAKSHIPVKVVERLPDNVFAPAGWPGPGLYLGPNGFLYLVVGSIGMMLPVESTALGIAGVHSGPLMAWSLLPVRCAATAG